MLIDVYSVSPIIHLSVVSNLAGAAALVRLDEHEIAWCIEEHGRCDTDEYVLVEAGSPAPQPLADGAAGNVA